VAIISKQLALAIADKLGAKASATKKQRPHDLYTIYEEGACIAMFGVRRGSKKEAGHDHVPRQLFVTPKDARDLAQCPMTREQWITKLREKGKI
jgi:hypothetical protein